MAQFSLFFNLLISRGSACLLNKEENSSLGGLPARSSGCSRFCTRRSSVLSSSRLRSHIVPLALAVVKSTAKPSRSPNLVAHDANFDGLSIAAVSQAFNSFESMHNSMTSSSLRSSTIHSGLHESSSSRTLLSCLMQKCSFVRALHLLHPRQRLQLSMSCVQAPQHLHQDVVLLPSLPILQHLHLVFSDFGFL